MSLRLPGPVAPLSLSLALRVITRCGFLPAGLAMRAQNLIFDREVPAAPAPFPVPGQLRSGELSASRALLAQGRSLDFETVSRRFIAEQRVMLPRGYCLVEGVRFGTLKFDCLANFAVWWHWTGNETVNVLCRF